MEVPQERLDIKQFAILEGKEYVGQQMNLRKKALVTNQILDLGRFDLILRT